MPSSDTKIREFYTLEKYNFYKCQWDYATEPEQWYAFYNPAEEHMLELMKANPYCKYRIVGHAWANGQKELEKCLSR